MDSNEFCRADYTTFYDQILTEFEANPDTKDALDSFQQVIPVDKVVTLSGFNLDAYVRFLAERQSEDGDSSPDTGPGKTWGPASISLLLLVGGILSRLLR